VRASAEAGVRGCCEVPDRWEAGAACIEVPGSSGGSLWSSTRCFFCALVTSASLVSSSCWPPLLVRSKTDIFPLPGPMHSKYFIYFCCCVIFIKFFSKDGAEAGAEPAPAPARLRAPERAILLIFISNATVSGEI